MIFLAVTVVVGGVLLVATFGVLFLKARGTKWED